MPDQTPSQLDMLQARGENIPEYVFALRDDIKAEMFYQMTGVEDKVDELREDYKRYQRTIESRLDTIGVLQGLAGNTENVVAVDEQVRTTASGGAIPALVKQVVEESAKLFQNLLVDSMKAMEQRLDASNEKRLAIFKEEMSKSVAEQIRVELGAKQTKNEDAVPGHGTSPSTGRTPRM